MPKRAPFRVIDWGDRYAPNWPEISRQCRKLTRYQCCYPGCSSRAIHSHHAVYLDKQGPVKGREIPGVHVFSLCEEHHKLAHSPKNWQKDKRQPELLNRNTSQFYLLLRQGWISKVRG